MLDEIKHWYLVILTLAMAILAYLFIRRGEKIKDLQREAVIGKLNNQLKDVRNKTGKDEKELDDAVEKYKRLRDSYSRMFDTPTKD